MITKADPEQLETRRRDRAMSHEAVQQQYRSSEEEVRGTFGDDVQRAAAFYFRYVNFILNFLPRHPARILDLGCGSAWSTWLLRMAGQEAYGTDLHAHAVEARRVDAGLPYVAADARRIPFADGSFDAVGLYQVLEHIPEPRRALGECLRVLRPGGRLIVVGPHLISVGASLVWTLKETGKALLRGGRWPRRGPETARHPFGNTLPEHYQFLWHHTRHTIRKLLGQRPVQFLMREPDPRPPFHADNDACYFCNPIDLVLWARQTPGVRPVRWWALDRRGARLLWPVGGGTWVVLEKAGSQNG